MPRPQHRLSALGVTRITRPGLHADGGGLYLQITPAGHRSWLFRYMRHRKPHGMGLGPLHTISLAEARNKALLCRKQLLEGIDPLSARRDAQAAQRAAHAPERLFAACAAAYITAHQATWKNAKHAEQWTNTLTTYAFPVIGALPVAEIDTTHMLAILKPLWTTKTETASRLRGRMENILDWAAVQGFRDATNPARWKGHLNVLLPKRSKVQSVTHHPALPYTEAPAFMRALRQQKGTAACALQLLILTATRTSEVIEAQWPEFHLDKALWVIPAERMKAGKEHRVPLSEAAVALLRTLKVSRQGTYVFPGARALRPLSNMAMATLLKRMGFGHITVHGFRSTFRDWGGEVSHYPREVLEHALAHRVEDKTEGAYARGALFDKRVHLMADWETYCQHYPKTPTAPAP